MSENSKSGYICDPAAELFPDGARLSARRWPSPSGWCCTFIEWADGWVKPYLPNFYNPDTYSPVAIPGFWASGRTHRHHLVGLPRQPTWSVARSCNFGESLLNRTPLVRTIYKSPQADLPDGAAGAGLLVQEGGPDRISEPRPLVAGLHRHGCQRRNRRRILRAWAWTWSTVLPAADTDPDRRLSLCSCRATRSFRLK